MRLSQLALARPRAVLASWAVVVGVLALLGLGLEDRLHRSNLQVAGTESAVAQAEVAERFGEAWNLTVLLEGPPAAVRDQARAVAGALGRAEAVDVIGPWSAGAARALRPGPRTTVLVVRVRHGFEEVSREDVPKIRAAVTSTVSAPVEAAVTGYPDVAAGIHGGTVDALQRAELIAAPLLALVLLGVFRSVAAALVPLLMGLSTIAAARGVLDLVNRVSDLDAVSLNLASMMGLALGVDYALLLVSRFREQLGETDSAQQAVAVAVRRTGPTVAFAGLAVGSAMVTAVFLAPGDILTSAAVGVLAAVAVSVLTALTALTAALALLGARVNRWSFGRTTHRDSRAGAAAFRAIGRPAVAGGLVLAVVAALAAPALALRTGPPDPRVLPADSVERRDFERVQHMLGRGWATPYDVTFVANRGRVTERRRLDALARWQTALTEDGRVRAALGPAAIDRQARPLESAPGQLRRSQRGLRRGGRAAAKLDTGLGRAEDGVGTLRARLGDAAAAASRLRAGAARGEGGVERLRAGLQRARRGAGRLLAGLVAARPGAQRLIAGTRRARRGTRRLVAGLERARAGAQRGLQPIRKLSDRLKQGAGGLEQLREPAGIAGRELEQALDALQRMLPTSKADPQYARALEAVATASGAVTGRNPLTGAPVKPGYDGLDAALALAVDQSRAAADGVDAIARKSQRLVDGLARLRRGADRLEAGSRRLGAGVLELQNGLERLGTGGGRLRGGLARLTAGVVALERGMTRLERGSGALARGLVDGTRQTGRLREGISRLEGGAGRFRTRLAALQQGSAGTGRLARTLGSGYAVLAALDSAPAGQRTAASFIVNLERGGSALRATVIPARGNPTRAGHPLRDRLEASARDVGRGLGLTATVGGPAALLQDFDSETSARLPLLVVALSGVTYLLLIPLLRSLLLPLLAVGLNVLTVAAAFGVLTLAFGGDAPLGGAGYLDAIMVLSIFSIVFGLSIDYEVFLLARMREAYDATGSTDEAVHQGLRKTAGVITGAALIMTAVFVAFALADIATMRQLGIGLTVAVLLDATLVRLILLPAAIRLAGARAWWLPAWIDRLLPHSADHRTQGARSR